MAYIFQSIFCICSLAFMHRTIWPMGQLSQFCASFFQHDKMCQKKLLGIQSVIYMYCILAPYSSRRHAPYWIL